MYHIVMGVGEEVDQAVEQARAIINLPRDAESIHVTIAYAFSFKRPNDNLTDFKSVQGVISIFDDADVEYDLRDTQAEPSEFVIEVAVDVGADLICVGGRKRTPAGQVLFGSVSQQIILKTNQPVLIATGTGNPE